MVAEDQIETKLVKWFSLAERWNAILLLDEADIFLERRATRDIQRNGIVSIFLRRLEYFRGLLFLTTNRVGQIDDAFLSRVTVVLQYDHLTDDTRKKIWTGFFKKLEKDSQQSPDNRKIEIDRYAQKYVLNDPEVRDLRWVRSAISKLPSASSTASKQKANTAPNRTASLVIHHINLCTFPSSCGHSKPLYRNVYPVTTLMTRNHNVSSQSSYPPQ